MIARRCFFSTHFLLWMGLFLLEPQALPAQTAQITRLTLIDAENNVLLGNLSPGSVLDLSTIGTNSLSFQAFTAPNRVDSVAMILEGPVMHRQTERIFPYALFGDQPDGTYQGKDFVEGDYTLTAIAYPGADTLRFDFSVIISQPQIRSFTLINAETQTEIGILADQSTIDLGLIGNIPLNIRANTAPTELGSVRFELRSPDAPGLNQTENMFPYALFGNDAYQSNQYLGQTLTLGSYTLTARGFTQAQTQGEAGEPLSIRFEVINSDLCVGNFVLSTQAEVDAFDCSELEGNLTISGENITDLSGLQGLTRVKGSLNISRNNQLTNLAGLENLQSVASLLRIEVNPRLRNLNGLAQLRHVGGMTIAFNDSLSNMGELPNLESLSFLSIQNNFSLENLDGLENLESLGAFTLNFNLALSQINGLSQAISTTADLGSIRINGNRALSNLEALNGLKSILGDLEITGNDALVNLFEARGLDSLAGILRIEDQENLVSLEGLENIPSAEAIFIKNNPALISLSGLSGLEMVGINLQIINNDALTSLEGLENLRTFQTGEILVSNNAQLNSLAGLENLEDLGEVLIGDNFVVGGIMISNNPQLSSLNAFGQLDRLAGSLWVSDNPLLSDCCAIQDLIPLVEGQVTIENNASGCNTDLEILDNCPAENLEASLVLFPNPSSEQMQLRLENVKAGSLKIYNDQGQVIYQEDFSGELRKNFEVASWQSGLYLLRVSTREGQEIQERIMVE